MGAAGGDGNENDGESKSQDRSARCSAPKEPRVASRERVLSWSCNFPWALELGSSLTMDAEDHRCILVEADTQHLDQQVRGS